MPRKESGDWITENTFTIRNKSNRNNPVLSSLANFILFLMLFPIKYAKIIKISTLLIALLHGKITANSKNRISFLKMVFFNISKLFFSMTEVFLKELNCKKWLVPFPNSFRRTICPKGKRKLIISIGFSFCAIHLFPFYTYLQFYL